MRFLLVDRILRLAPGTDAVIVKNVSNSEDFFTDHFSGRPIMPGCLILETCDQAARLLLAKSWDFCRLPVLETVENGKFQHFVQPGDSLHVHVVQVSQEDQAVHVRATVSVEERTVARVSLHYRLADAAHDPGTARTCARMREFYEILTTDPVRIAWENRTRIAQPTQEASGA
jgi:3-hydroxyacyl-[acyl-carrier-protein] dehydratase